MRASAAAHGVYTDRIHSRNDLYARIRPYTLCIRRNRLHTLCELSYNNLSHNYEDGDLSFRVRGGGFESFRAQFCHVTSVGHKSHWNRK